MSPLRCLLVASLLLPLPALAQEPTPEPTEAPAEGADVEDEDSVSARDAQQEEETPEQTIDRLLKTRQITLNFEKTPLSEALLFLQDITGAPFIRHPTVPEDVTVTLRLRDLSLLNALKLILASREDLDFAIWSGAVIVKTKAVTLPAQPTPRADAPEGSVERKLATARMSCNFPETPPLEVFDFLRDLSALNIVLTPAAQAKCEESLVDLQGRDLDLGRILNLVTIPYGLRWSVKDEVLTIDVAKSQ